MPRRKRFGDRLEIERDDAGVLGKMQFLERVMPRGEDDIIVKGLSKAADVADSHASRTSAPTRQWLGIAGGAFVAVLAWFLALAVPAASAGGLELLVIAGAVLGPAAACYGAAQFVWPEPPVFASASTVGGGTLDEARRHRLWVVRVVACVVGIVHLLVLWSLT